MKQRVIQGALVAALLLVLTTAAAFAGGPPDPRGGPGGGVSGSVTAVGTNSLTVLTSDSESVPVTTSSSTKVEILATGASGSLSDVVVGSYVEVRGPAATDGSITAEMIVVLPGGDQVSGRVTAVSGMTITVQTRDGAIKTIVTTSTTTFRKGPDMVKLSDVTVGADVRGFGTLQSDGSLLATFVSIQGAPGGPGGNGPGGPAGPGGSGGGPGGQGGGPGGPGGRPGGR